jgi:HSP20 family protein
MANRDRRDQSEISRRASDAPPRTRDYYPGSARGLDPFTQFRRLSDQMERWFENVAGLRRADRSSETGLWSPEVETFMRDDKFIIRADLPGLSKDEVNVEITEDSVIISGERQNVHEEEREGYYRSERVYGRFYREIPLPEGALPETAQAESHDGVLEISVTAPPREVTKPRRISIGGKATSGEQTSTGTGSSGQRSR